MSELGDLVELLHTSDRRWRTFRAAGREWRHTERLMVAFLRDVPAGRPLTRSRRREMEGPIDHEERWSLWVAPEAKMRAEFEVGEETVTVVFDGDRWWNWSPSGGAQTNAAAPGERLGHGSGPGATLLETAPILPALALEILDRATFAAKDVVVVRATPVPTVDDSSRRSFLHGLGSGADEYELLVDAERGVLLRAEARLAGAPFKITEVDEVAFDENLPPETFVLELPRGETFSTPPVYRDIPLDRLPAEVPFTILVPEHPPIPGPMEPRPKPRGTVIPAASRWNVPEHVHIGYQLGSGRMLTLRESAEPMPIRDEQELEERQGLLVGEDRSVEPPRTNVRLEREGTHIELEGAGMSLDELVWLARSLVPLRS